MFSIDNLCKMERVSLEAAAVIEDKLGLLGEISVDFMLDTCGRPWIIEVNGHTQKSFVKRLHDHQMTNTIYRNPLEYATFLAGKEF